MAVAVGWWWAAGRAAPVSADRTSSGDVPSSAAVAGAGLPAVRVTSPASVRVSAEPSLAAPSLEPTVVAAATQEPALSSPPVAPGSSAGPAAGPGEREPVGAALVRLSRARAEAFEQVSEIPLADVDAPGSPALAADSALVGRLRAAGVRLEGLSFAVEDVSSDPVGDSGPDGALTIRATVTTSAHRQVSLTDPQAATAVPAARPTAIVLALVPAPDGVHWLVRQTWGQS